MDKLGQEEGYAKPDRLQNLIAVFQTQWIQTRLLFKNNLFVNNSNPNNIRYF